jgi:REP element-mobilizing transposase RayT
MPRKPRHIVPGGVYPLISRFVDREWFITSAHEREHYLSLLGRALNDSDWTGLGYGVMSNHVHIEAIAGRDSLSSWIRRVHSRFADTMNRAQDWLDVRSRPEGVRCSAG